MSFGDWRTTEVFKVYIDGELKLITANEQEAKYLCEQQKRELRDDHVWLIEKSIVKVLYDEED